MANKIYFGQLSKGTSCAYVQAQKHVVHHGVNCKELFSLWLNFGYFLMVLLLAVLQPAAVGRPYLPSQGGGAVIGRGSPVGGVGNVPGGYSYTSPAGVSVTPPMSHLPPPYSSATSPSPAVSRPPSVSYTPPMTYPGGAGAPGPGSLLPASDMYDSPGPPQAPPGRPRSMSVTPTLMLPPEVDQLPPGIQLPPGVFALFDK